MARRGSQPMVVLSEDSQRMSGRDAQEMNMRAAKAVASAVRTTLGPEGMDKMLVDSSGDVAVTNDGVTVLDQMDIDHPAADMIVQVAQTQEAEIGDGTTSAVIVAGELLSQAEELLGNDVHPTRIVRGYRQAAQEARSVLEENADSLDQDDPDQLAKIAATALTGKGAETAKDHLVDLVVRAVTTVVEDGGIDRDRIQLKRSLGAATEDSELIEGVLISKDPVRNDMPTHFEDANVAILRGELEEEELELDAEFNVSDPEKLDEFRADVEADLEGVVEGIIDAGADVVVTTEGISDFAQDRFARAGILALRRIDDSDAYRLARSTGGRVVTEFEDITADDLGSAGLVAQQERGDDERIHFVDVANPTDVVLLLRGGTDHVVDEVERAVKDSIDVVIDAYENGSVVPGGSAGEIRTALALRDFAEGVGGREQLAVEAFADALEAIPRTLAENAGHDPIDSIVDLRSAHAAGDDAAGLDALTGDVVDMREAGVLEPLRVKTQAIDTATEAASMILRIDDVISAGDLSTGGDDDEAEGPPGGPGGPGGAPGGMGGMGGGMGGMGGMGGGMM